MRKTYQLKKVNRKKIVLAIFYLKYYFSLLYTNHVVLTCYRMIIRSRTVFFSVGDGIRHAPNFIITLWSDTEFHI